MKKTVWVTGVQKQTAMEAAIWFARHEYNVYVSTTDGSSVATKFSQLSINFQQPDSIAEAVGVIDDQVGCLDLLVCCPGVEKVNDGVIGSGLDYEKLLNTLDVQVNGMKTLIDQCIPLLQKGKTKRIAMITSKDSTISWNEETTEFAYYMTLASINMMGKIYFNALRPEGFTFRWFGEGDKQQGMSAAHYIDLNLCYDEKEPYIHSDENRFVLRDSNYREISW